MVDVQFGGAPLNLDEGDELLGDPHTVVSKFAPDLVLSGEILILVIAEAIAQEVSNKQPGIALIGITGDQFSEWPAETPDSHSNSIASISLPLGQGPSRRLLLRGDRRAAATCPDLNYRSVSQHYARLVCHAVPHPFDNYRPF